MDKYRKIIARDSSVSATNIHKRIMSWSLRRPTMRSHITTTTTNTTTDQYDDYSNYCRNAVPCRPPGEESVSNRDCLMGQQSPTSTSSSIRGERLRHAKSDSDAIQIPRQTNLSSHQRKYNRTIIQKLRLSRPTVFLPPLLLFIIAQITLVNANILPQFLLSDGQSEIVLRLKEGPASPVGSLIYTLKGIDRDGDPLTFGLKGQIANEILRIENRGRDTANLYLKKELDREVEDEYMIILTLNDGKLAEPVQQSLLLLVEDTNDERPVFKPYQSTVKVTENGKVPQIITTLEANDRDEGPYGQVIYKLQLEDGDEGFFTLNTVNGQAVVKLVKPLDYERKFLHQIKVLAMDRAETEAQINQAIASIVVQVQDLEDTGPTFIAVPPVTKIREDVPVNSFVLQVRAIDGDRGINNAIKYSLVNDNEKVFEIDSDSGIVYTKEPLDRENARGGSYVLNIVATEQSKISPKPSVETTLVVNLLDIDDERPRFKSTSYLAEITENSQEGVPVTFLAKGIPEVFDHDLGLNGTFRLKTDGDGGIFEVTPSEGINHVSFLIRVKNPARLDYEKMKEINFTIIAEDMTGDKFSKVPISVAVLDANDNIPEFEKEQYEVLINENSPPGTVIVRVNATDPDSGNFGTRGIRYTSITGSIANELSLDPVSGLITIKATNKTSLDRELATVYYLSVEAQDNKGRGNRKNVQIIINLKDENDESPVFLQSRYEARIFENEMEFVSPVRFQARDNDLKDTPNSEVHYTIIAGNEEGWLEVDDLSGKLKVVKPFDFEKLSTSPISPLSNVKHLNFTIRAHDSGIPSRFALSFLTLFVFDTNDFSPRFTRTHMSRIIREDFVGGSQIAKVESSDLDGSSPFNRVFYRIETGGQDKFVIESETGVLRLTPGAQLDYNIKPNHILEIIAQDGGGRQSEAPCVINITLKDINNKKPKFEFNAVEEESNAGGGSNGVYFTKVAENSPKGHFIMQVKASDPDTSAVLRYNIDFNKSDARNEDGRVLLTNTKTKPGSKLRGVDLSKLFILDPTEGILSVGGGLDRELMETVRLYVVVQDIGSETGEQKASARIEVTILDENDSDPKFRMNPYMASVPENAEKGTKIITVIADDPDKDRVIRYSIVSGKEIGKNQKFPLAIDPETGVIELVDRVDRELTDWINFTVLAEDSGTNPKNRHSSVPVFLRVIDQNDNAPMFVDNLTNITVPEDAQVGSIIAKVVAKDMDSGNYGKITYLLDRKSSMGKFTIDSETGAIRVAEPLDREEKSSYTLVIQAWDNFQFGYASGESRNAFKQLNLAVSDINDSPPEFLDEDVQSATGKSLRSGPTCASVTEFHEELILTIRAKDRDDETTANGKVTFKIKSGNELGLFKLQLGKNIAKVLPARSLKGFYGNYTLTIEAQDGGRPPNVATKEFNLCVLDYNDNKPRFINPAQNFTIKVPENATVGSSIIQVRAVDSDIGDNGIVRYRFRQEFSRHSETFHINPTTGVLTLAKLLDRERQKVYYLRIEAYDLGQPTPLSSELDLTIVVKNVDDFKPAFVKNEFIAQLTENISPGRERIQLPGTIDRDDEDDEEKKTSQVCYFILSDSKNSTELFEVDALSHVLTTKVRLDREKQPMHNFTILATDNCHQDIKRLHLQVFDKGSLLSVQIEVADVNDNMPIFTQRTFTGGVSTSSDYGTEILTFSATDADTPPNAKLTYFIIHPITMSLSEGLSHLINNDNPLFSIDPNSGILSLAFDPQPDMKGHFSLNVGVNDTTDLSDKANALVYLLRDDQKVKITVRMSPIEVRSEISIFKQSLSNVTGAIVNADASFKYHENRDGSVDKTKTDFYIHLVHPDQNIVLEADEVLKLIDLNIEELDDLFKEFNVLDTQKSTFTVGATFATKGREETKNLFLVYAIGTALFLALLLLVVISICFAQRSKYQRQLKAATTNAYGSSASIIPRTGNVPNTNVHSVEGSNPIWMQAYHNNCEASDTRDSLDENAIGTESTSPPSSHMRSFLGTGSGGSGSGGGGSDKELCRRNDLNRTYHRNLIYGNRIESAASGNCLILKKHLETTEL
ncbi:cadherin-23-like isoform X3 [Folsomia candida]|uniref:cadherin-23-like isoform X3 n=1 Tax=Folsomia candida TaxID=158441 RepID=UPI001604CED1|nr:cadherin-23-like isoform X3 [Folsomia candida]